MSVIKLLDGPFHQSNSFTSFIRMNKKSLCFLYYSVYEPGFENEAYFSRFFKKSTDIIPREFTKKCASKSTICTFLNNGKLLL